MDGILIMCAALLALYMGYLIYGDHLIHQWGVNPKRVTPAAAQDDGDLFARSRTPVVLAAQFASLTGWGIVQGTVSAMEYGWLPALLWLVFGGLFLGSVIGFSSLLVSVRNGGRTLGGVLREYMSWRSGTIFLVIAWLTAVLTAAILLDVGTGMLSGFTIADGGGLVQNVHNGSAAMGAMLMLPAGIFIGYLNRLNCPVIISTLLGLVLMGCAVAAGIIFPLYLRGETWIYVLLALLLLVCALPAWFLLQPVNYLSGLCILLMMFAMVCGIFGGGAHITIAPFTGWSAQGEWLFPGMFVMMAGSALSAYYGLMSSAVASRQLNNEKNARLVGCGSVMLQCFLGVLVLVAVGSLQSEGNPGLSASPMELFETAVFGLIRLLGVGKEWLLPLRTVILFLAVMMVLSALYGCARMGTVVFAELFGGKDVKNSLNSGISAIFTAGAVYGCYALGYRHVWSVLGIYLVLLAVPACQAAILWLRRIGRKSTALYLPLAGAAAISAAALTVKLAENLKPLVTSGVEAYSLQMVAELFLLVSGGVFLVQFLLDGGRAGMKKQRIIFATGNEGKMREIREILGDLDLEILSMKEAGIQVDVEENGETFEENALIKARAVSEASGYPVLADDSGLEIDYLDKAPGVYSARYMGEDTPYSIKNAKILERLEGVPDEQRTARFVCVIAAVFPDGRTVTTRGTMEGQIGYEARGENGFGYDPIFFLKEYNCTSAELSMEEKNKISHRGEALRAMKGKLS